MFRSLFRSFSGRS